jgi:hypothetical protein
MTAEKLTFDRRNLLLGGTTLAQSLPPSPNWARAMPPGPDVNVKITDGYARLVARDAYFWHGRWSTSTTAGLPSSRRPSAG